MGKKAVVTPAIGLKIRRPFDCLSKVTDSDVTR